MASDLPLEATVGFSGTIPSGLQVHPSGQFLIYPLGSTVVIRDLKNPRQSTFLQGHSDKISCLALSKSGRYIASGQVTYMGFQADIIVWDFVERKLVHRLVLHKVKVQSLAFSHNDRYLASLGGQDDNNIVIWNVETGQAICGNPAANDNVLVVKWFNNRDDALVTAGNYSLRVWDFDLENRKVRPTDCNLGRKRRIINDLVIDDDDQYMYAGSSSGDLFQVSLGPKLYKHHGPKQPLTEGILSVAKLPNGDLLVGSGDGTITLMKKDTLLSARNCKIDGGVTSISLTPDGKGFFAGSRLANMYYVPLGDLRPELRGTCHFSRINDIAFPKGYSELFATCSIGDIRIWHARQCTELLRIQVQGIECHCICFTDDGKMILSGWGDGKVRAFGPQSGKLLFVIKDAHIGAVTAIAATHDCARLLTGGVDGQVRVWKLGKESQVMLASMKEHTGAVNDIKVRKNDTEFVSSSSDGSCIIWDLNRYVRNNSLFASTFFKSIVYFPDESQLLTTGTDRKITYWDAFDGSAIRVLEGSDSAEMCALDISSTGDKFVSGGADKLVKVWNYDEGLCKYRGIGHSGAITRLKISPDQRSIVSVGEEGAILIWQAPLAG
eukprot:tig00000704_g3333.t1